MSDTESDSRTCAYVLGKRHEETINALAFKNYDNNKSMALRRIVEYAETNLFPLLGIEKPTQEQPV